MTRAYGVGAARRFGNLRFSRLGRLRYVGAGPFTVLAPTDAAFAKLPKGTVETLLKPENKSKLQEVLKRQVVAGQLLAREVLNHVMDTVLMPGDAQRMMSAAQPKDLVTLAIERGTPLYNHGQSGACAAVYEVTAAGIEFHAGTFEPRPAGRFGFELAPAGN
jgi:Fasciclin domain